MKPGKLITFLIQQKKAGIFIFNTTVLVIASFVAGYNIRLNETKPATTLIVRLTSDYIAGAIKRFAPPPAAMDKIPLHTSSVFTAPPSPPANEETTRPTEKNEIPIIPPDPIPRKQPRAALPRQKAPIKKKKVKKREVPSKASTEKKKSWNGYTDVIRTVEKGETVSHFVRKRHIPDFMVYNNLPHPDRIYAGQSFIVRLPTTFVTSALHDKKNYMNHYVITAATGPLGREIFLLVKKDAPAERETLLSLRIKKERREINRSTIPYLNLSEYTNTLTRQKKRAAVASGNFSLTKTTAPQIKRPLVFETDFTSKAFENNRFHGFKSLDLLPFNHNTNAIKKFIRHLIRNRSGAMTDTDYHFLIFGETLVQIRYLEGETFKAGNGETVIHIGVVHKTADTPATLKSLRQELSQSRGRDGTLEIITAKNMSFFFH